MYLLDTNVICELRRGKRAQSETVRDWASKLPITQLYLSSITVLEVEIGVRRMLRKDPSQGAVLRAWADAVLREFEGRVLPFSVATAPGCADLQVPDPCSLRDSMMAATAAEHGFTIVTRNVGDYASSGVPVVNPWEAPLPNEG